MVRFNTKIPKSSGAYKTIEAALTEFKRQEPGENWVVFGSLILVNEKFTGIIISTEDAKGIQDALNKVITASEVPEAPPTPIMTAKAGKWTYADMIEASWTHEQLVEHGYVEEDIPF